MADNRKGIKTDEKMDNLADLKSRKAEAGNEQERTVWYTSRKEAGKSQEYMALELNVARKTVQNWEKGVTSPTIHQAKLWFAALGSSPIPYLVQELYSGTESMDGLLLDAGVGRSSKVSSGKANSRDQNGGKKDSYGRYGQKTGLTDREKLKLLIDTLPEEGISQLLYLISGDHGSSPRAVLQLITAHLQTPMRDRVTQAGVIIKNYEIAHKKNLLSNKDQVQPNMKLLHKAWERGEQAVMEDEDSYNMI